MARRTQFFVQTFRAPSLEISPAWASEAAWQPRVDVYQTDDEILIHVEAAGLREDDLQLHFEDGQLIIEGRRERPDLPCPQHCLQVEIAYGAFRRVLALPRDADSGSIRAAYSNGVLQVTAPRRAPEKTNVKISVE
jgi:HSP20 family protein